MFIKIISFHTPTKCPKWSIAQRKRNSKFCLLKKQCLIFLLPKTPVSHPSTLFLTFYDLTLMTFFQLLKYNKSHRRLLNIVFFFSWLVPPYPSNFSGSIPSWAKCRCSVVLNHKACMFHNSYFKSIWLFIFTIFCTRKDLSTFLHCFWICR